MYFVTGNRSLRVLRESGKHEKYKAKTDLRRVKDSLGPSTLRPNRLIEQESSAHNRLSDSRTGCYTVLYIRKRLRLFSAVRFIRGVSDSALLYPIFMTRLDFGCQCRNAKLANHSRWAVMKIIATS